jgi:SAM-dependent methyltransferase
MIAEAKRRAKGIAGAAFELGDSEHLPFADAEFTAVLCTTSLHHYPHPDRAIGEMARVLAPDGRVVISDANRDRFAIRLLDHLARRFQKSHARILNSSELERLLRDVGLVSVGVRSLGHGGYMLAQGRKPSEPKDG